MDVTNVQESKVSVGIEIIIFPSTSNSLEGGGGGELKVEVAFIGLEAHLTYIMYITTAINFIHVHVYNTYMYMYVRCSTLMYMYIKLTMLATALIFGRASKMNSFLEYLFALRIVLM